MKNNFFICILLVISIPLLLIILFSWFFEAITPEPQNLGMDWYYYDEAQIVVRQNNTDTLKLIIPSKVISFNNTLTTILIEQQPDKYDNVIFPHYDYPSGRDSTYYWFIDKQSNYYFGPVVYSDMKSFLCDKQLEDLFNGL